MATGRSVSIFDGVEAMLDDLEELYKDVHRHPELSMQEERTAGIAAERLENAGFEVTTGVGKTGVVGVLRNGDGPTVMLRADMPRGKVSTVSGVEHLRSYGLSEAAAGRDGVDASPVFALLLVVIALAAANIWLSGSPCLTSRRIQGGRVRCTSFHRASPSASPTGRPNRRRRNRGQGRPTRTERTKSLLWGTLRHGEGRRPRSRRRQRLARRGRRHRTRTLHAHNPGRSAASGPRDRATLEVRATRSRTQRPYPRAQHIRHRSTPEQGIDPPAARGVLGR